MLRHLVRNATLAVALAIAATAPLHAQDQKGTLVFAVETLSAQTLDPILEGRPGNAVYQAVMYDSLVGFNLEKGGVGPGVAERWELSPDGLTWTFYLRPGQTFHNGDKLTAHDVKFSLERQMGPGSLAAAAATMKRTIKSIEVVDELTVKVNTTSPQIGLPASLSRAVAPEGAIMPKNYIEKVGEEEFRKKPIGSGPWKFVRNVPGDRIEFTAVAKHWRGTPHFKDLHMLLVPEESTRVAMVRTGEAAIASIGPEAMLGASRAGLEVLSVPGTMQAIFQFWGTYKPEVKDSPIAKARVRQALSLAIDRKQVIEHVMNGKARMPYPFSTFGYTDYFSADRWEKWAAEAYRYDPVLAKKILAEEGYPNGFELKFANTALPGTQFMVDIGTAIADMWTKVGVKVTLKHYEWGSFAPMERGDQAPLIGWASMYRTAGRPDAPWRYNGAFSPDSTQRLLGDKENCPQDCQDFVKTYQALGAELDKDKRTALTDRMVEITANSWTVIPIIEGMGYYAINTKKVGQFNPIPGRHELGDVFERIPRPEQKPWKK
ncbi:MAG: ABC transporter substrate-binding protein [Reyranella sp.]|nr:ABC transporter substrate-binding protein [Reyranella sp.]MDP3160211.1 ABC transporter substrate-binding protein [Reyranella sp.]